MRLLVLLLSASLEAVAADPLPRGAALGVALAPAEGRGALVRAVLPGLTGEKLGVAEGDVIVAIDGRPVAGPGAVVAIAGALDGGDKVTVVVSRGGKERTLKGKATPRPYERYDGATVDYGAVDFQGGRLRDILVLPAGVQAPPVVFLVQGFSCATVEPMSPDHPYRRLTAELVARGIGVYRVEKPGLGDSEGGPRCADIDFETEVAAFGAAWNALADVRGVDPDRVFFFGHSLGGIQAPLLAAARAPRGVIPFGTIVGSWHDYHLELLRTQGFLSAGQDPVESAEQAETARELLRRFYLENTPPARLAAENPAWRQLLVEGFEWDGQDHLMGRHYGFWHDLDEIPLVRAWRDTRSHVLSMYGESDFTALTSEEHQLIAAIANHYRPGTGTFLEVPRTGHGMTVVGARSEVRAAARAGGEVPEGPFNVEVAEHVARWIGEVMKTAPVRLAATDGAG